MGKRNTTKDFIEKARQLHNDKYDYSQTVYVNSRTKLTITCPEHGAFEQRASSHLQGNGCPECAKIWSDEHRRNLQESSRKSRGMSTEEWVERAKRIHGDKYDYSQTIYMNQRTNVKIICPRHGLFEQNADSHLRGCGCKWCAYEDADYSGREWTDEQREKIAETCRKKYGADRYLDSEEGKLKVKKIRANPEYRKKMRNIISSKEVQEKTKNTCIRKYGECSAMKLPETVDKVYNTKMQHGTWNTSETEEKMYIRLCEYFGYADVCRQYKEVRYPYYCDFYIKSLDLFIELNATWLHGYHWFDESSVDDQNKLAVWRHKVSMGKEFYSVAINTWTRRDIAKRDTAIKNHLNYVVFWDNNLLDFEEWLKAESLSLNNVIT